MYPWLSGRNTSLLALPPHCSPWNNCRPYRAPGWNPPASDQARKKMLLHSVLNSRFPLYCRHSLPIHQYRESVTYQLRGEITENRNFYTLCVYFLKRPPHHSRIRLDTHEGTPPPSLIKLLINSSLNLVSCPIPPP